MDFNNAINRIYFFVNNQAKNFISLNYLLPKSRRKTSITLSLVWNLFVYVNICHAKTLGKRISMNLRKTSKQNKEWKRKRPGQPDIRTKPLLFNGRRKKIKNQPSRADNARAAFLIDCSEAGRESEPKKAFKWD